MSTLTYLLNDFFVAHLKVAYVGVCHGKLKSSTYNVADFVSNYFNSFRLSIRLEYLSLFGVTFYSKVVGIFF